MSQKHLIEARKAFCALYGHHYITWLPKQRRIEHKRCTYCGELRNKPIGA